MSSFYSFMYYTVNTLAPGLVFPSSREMKLFFANLCLQYSGHYNNKCNKDDLFLQILFLPSFHNVIYQHHLKTQKYLINKLTLISIQTLSSVVCL